MPAVTVRPAEAADVDVVLALLRELGYPIARDLLAERLAAFRDSAADHVLLATVGGQVVGLICVSITPLLVEGALGRITALVVHERHRGKGIGAALVAEAEERAGAAGCAVIQVSSGRRPERAAAHRFYEHLGYTDAGCHHTLYERRIGQRRPETP